MLAQQKKISWSCRRGMKELDFYLQPFCDNMYPLLDEQQQDYFSQLLALDDLVLFDCFFKQRILSEPHLQALINLLKLYRKQHVAY